jgi:hypothetical protein
MSNMNTWSVDQAVPLAPKGRGSIDLEIDFLNPMLGTYYAVVEVASMYEIHARAKASSRLMWSRQTTMHCPGGRGAFRFGVFLNFLSKPCATTPC